MDHLPKTKKEYKNLKKQEIWDLSELDKVCFQHDMALRDIKDFQTRTASDKLLDNKAFNIAKDAKYDGYQTGLVSIVYKLFGKKSAPLADISTASSGLKNKSKNELKQNKQ